MKLSDINIGDRLKTKWTVGPFPYGSVFLVEQDENGSLYFNSFDTMFFLHNFLDENGNLNVEKVED